MLSLYKRRCLPIRPMQPLAQYPAGHTLAPVSEASARHSGERETRRENPPALSPGVTGLVDFYSDRS